MSALHPYLIDLNADIGLKALRSITLSAWLFLPKTKPRALIVCLAGASYTKSYYHSVFAEHEGYSFGAEMARQSFAVLAIDHPGMGASAQPDNVGLLTRENVANLHQSALEDFLERSKMGEWERALHYAMKIGVGHSLGGMILTQWQATHMVFDKVAFLGWTNTGLSFDPSQLPVPKKLPAYLPTDRHMMRPIFHMPNVPSSLIDIDDEGVSLTPSSLAIDGMTAGIVREQAGEITCPVFTCFGDVDISPDPLGEVAHFKSSRDITLLRLEDSAHNHNFAQTRHTLWSSLACWAATPELGT